MFEKSRTLEFAMAAQWAAAAIEERLLCQEEVSHEIDTALVLGHGWDVFDSVIEMPLRRLPNFTDIITEEHRVAVLEIPIKREGRRELKQVVALIAPLYQHEAHDYKWLRMTRLQIEMILRLRKRREGRLGVRTGPKRLILCDGGIGLNLRRLPAIVPVNGFCTLFAQRMPLSGSEHYDPNSILDLGLYEYAKAARSKSHQPVIDVPREGGGHVFVHGPGLHRSAYDMNLLHLSGASVVSQGLLPWAYLAAKPEYQPPTLALTLVMGNVHLGPDHDAFLARAFAHRRAIRNYMSRLLSSLT